MSRPAGQGQSQALLYLMKRKSKLLNEMLEPLLVVHPVSLIKKTNKNSKKTKNTLPDDKKEKEEQSFFQSLSLPLLSGRALENSVQFTVALGFRICAKRKRTELHPLFSGWCTLAWALNNLDAARSCFLLGPCSYSLIRQSIFDTFFAFTFCFYIIFACAFIVYVCFILIFLTSSVVLLNLIKYI